MKISKKIILDLNKFLLNKIKPDFTFVNIINKKNMYLRLKKRKIMNRYDKFNFSFYSKVQKGFLKIAKNKKNYLVIDSNDNLKKNKQLIINKIKSII